MVDKEIEYYLIGLKVGLNTALNNKDDGALKGEARKYLEGQHMMAELITTLLKLKADEDAKAFTGASAAED